LGGPHVEWGPPDLARIQADDTPYGRSSPRPRRMVTKGTAKPEESLGPRFPPQTHPVSDLVSY